MIWEYLCIYTTSIEVEDDLNRRGKEGWELCGIVRFSAGNQLIFKRQIVEVEP